MIKRIVIYTLAICLSIVANGQNFTSLGLGMEKCERLRSYYYPQMHIDGDSLIACTNQGLYSNKIGDAESVWRLIGFDGIAVQDFVYNGQDILALCYNENEDHILLSHDGGKTYEDVTPVINKENEMRINSIAKIVQHPTDRSTILISSYQYGVYKSSDFGQTWSLLTTIIPTYFGYHPLNPEIITTGGRNANLTPCIYNSYDGGQTWVDCSPYYSSDNTVNYISFNSLNPDKWIACGSASVYTSSDNGRTWNLQDYVDDDNKDANWRVAAYDNENSDIVYMAGSFVDSITVMCSTDGGNTWNNPVCESMKKSMAEKVYDLKQYGSKLYIYTEADVYEISKTDLLTLYTAVQSADAGNPYLNKVLDFLGREQVSEPSKGYFIINGQKSYYK